VAERPEHALEAVREVAERAVEVRAPRELHHLAQGFARRVSAAAPPVRRLCGAAGRPGRCNECSSEYKDECSSECKDECSSECKDECSSECKDA